MRRASPFGPGRKQVDLPGGISGLMLALAVILPAGSPVPGLAASGDSTEVVLVKSGRAQMPIVAGSLPQPVERLQHYLKEISGAEFELAPADKAKRGIHVGLAGDFPRLKFDSLGGLGPEGFLLRSDGKNVYLIGQQPRGVQHAVTTFLHGLGCRWFFPGKAWRVIPRRDTIAGAWDRRQTPDFPVQRSIWPGYGLYPQNRADWDDWNRHNRMGGPGAVRIHHSWVGLNPELDFQKHPQWFALVGGKRQPSKPCYSHPEVIGRAIRYALREAEAGAGMVTVSAPDGLGFCRCDRCLATLKGGEPYEAHGTTWAKRGDGVLLGATSQTLFRLANEVAGAVAKKYPNVRIGCYAYSAYSHPPSFKLHPNVYVQITTCFRRTPLSLGDQLAAFGEKTALLGVREYYSVYQWDFDEPYPGRVRPDRLQRDLRFFRAGGATAVNAEASNNWAARGLGYYVASQLMWDVDADVDELMQDFYHKAFGPAAAAVERYYARWYGPRAAADEKEPAATSIEDLRASYRHLDEAAGAVRGRPAFQQRVDHLRMYLHYLVLRHRLREAAARGDKRDVLAAIEAETVFGGRLNDTNMIHTRALIGKAFLRRFRKYRGLLAELPEAGRDGKAWRRLGTPPTREQIEQLWAEDKQILEKGS